MKEDDPRISEEGNQVSAIVIFNEEERRIVAECLARIEKKNTGQLAYIRDHLESLSQLAQAISRYPSILGTQKLGERPRSPHTLVQMLCRQPGHRRILHVPTRAVLGKSFLVAKINFLHLIKYVYASSLLLKSKTRAIQEAIATNIFTLMSEDVFLEIIEANDVTLPTKEKAALQLIGIWQWRLNRNITEYAPVLFSMWKARKHLRPIFGTLVGVSELYQISRQVHPVWSNFLADCAEREEVHQALEEFLFNLTHEELVTLRREMRSRGMDSIDPRRAASIIGRSDFRSDFNDSDPRELYAFFRLRRQNARFRSRAGHTGPGKTIEEFLLLYLLDHDMLLGFGPAPPGREAPARAPGRP